MRQTIGTTTTFKAAILFTIMFSAFLALAITYNRAFRLKNESIAILEKYEGVSPKSLQIINNYLRNSGYQGQGHCEDGEYGVNNLEDNKLVTARPSELYYYCVFSECTDSSLTITSDGSNKIIYRIKLFYKFNLPVFGDLFNYTISGKTKRINYYDEKQLLKNNR
jgi:hypothetical protein